MQPLFKQHLVAVILVKVAEDFGVSVLPDAGRDQLECTVSILNRAQKPPVAREIFYGEQIISVIVITHVVCLVRFVMHRLGASWGFHWDRALRRGRVRLRAGCHWRAAWPGGPCCGPGCAMPPPFMVSGSGAKCFASVCQALSIASPCLVYGLAAMRARCSCAIALRAKSWASASRPAAGTFCGVGPVDGGRTPGCWPLAIASGPPPAPPLGTAPPGSGGGASCAGSVARSGTSKLPKVPYFRV